MNPILGATLMCLILLACEMHSTYPLVLAANRDERYDRPAAAAAWWSDAPGVLAGRDLEGLGTWLGVARDGRWAAVTNVREPTVSQRPDAPSRGWLVSGFLRGAGPVEAYLAALAPRADEWNGFNLLAGDAGGAWWLSNRAPGPVRVEPGVHGLSNALLDTPWPKVERGRDDLARILAGPEAAMEASLFRTLALRDPAPDERLPDTGVGLYAERMLSSLFISSAAYGTRASTVLRIRRDGRVFFAERTIDPESDRWTEVRHEFEGGVGPHTETQSRQQEQKRSMPIQTINPATGETLRTFDALTGAEVDARLERAEATFQEYRHTSFAQRAAWMMRAAEILAESKDTLARLMTTEMGKPLTAAVAEVEKCAWACRHYADNAERLLADEKVETDARRSFIRYLPLGPVLAVMPWNFPLWQVFRFAAPALMAGNVGVLKHASNVPQCALAIEDVFRQAGFPDGAFQTLLVGSEAVARILDDPRIRAATLTGSTPAGQSVAERAGRNLKKTVLELGGSDPFIVMPSADLDAAARTAVKARVINNGQSCIAAKRFIVHQDVADEFEQRFIAAMRALRIGDPMNDATDVGPLATAAIRDEVDEQVRRSVEMGARVLVGGERIDGPGFYYAPTILTDIPRDAPAYHEEVFGPVALLHRARDAEDALRLANDTVFGLGSSVWTRDEAEADFFIRGIEAGMTYVNAMVASDPRLPFGGVKQSGYGRELAAFGIREFVNVKTVWMEDGGGPGEHPAAE